MRIVLHGGRFDGDAMEFALSDQEESELMTIDRPDLPHKLDASIELPLGTLVPNLRYLRSNRVLRGATVFVLEGTKL